MRALSLWQPWATAMQLGQKRNETRGWPTSYRGDIAIHAAKHCRALPHYDSIPKFEQDLNAMHEAYLALSPRMKERFRCSLLQLTKWPETYTATALQRAQAFILAHNQPKAKKRK